LGLELWPAALTVLALAPYAIVHTDAGAPSVLAVAPTAVLALSPAHPMRADAPAPAVHAPSLFPARDYGVRIGH